MRDWEDYLIHFYLSLHNSFAKAASIAPSLTAMAPASEDSGSEWSAQESVGIEGEDSNDDDDEEDDNVFLQRGRTILWFCQEGQLRLARQRFEYLLEKSQHEDNDSAGDMLQQLRKEVFQVGRDKNYALHEILMGGTSDSNAFTLTLQILHFATNYPTQQLCMLSMQPPSHGRTALHWAVWGNASLGILKALVRGNPEAMLKRDKKSQGERTPREILKHYFPRQNARSRSYTGQQEVSQNYSDDSRIVYLEGMERRWIAHRVRLAVLLCAQHYFQPRNSDRQVYTPFDNKNRKLVNIKPKPWFLLSILGYFLQREMKPLVLKIVDFLGSNAAAPKRKKSPATKKHSLAKKRKNSHSP